MVRLIPLLKACLPTTDCHSKDTFDALQEISGTLTPNDEYENFVNAYMEAATVHTNQTKRQT